MSDEFREVYINTLSNQPKDTATHDFFRKMLRDQFNSRLVDSVERMWGLPSFIVKPSGEYLQLFLEARDLYIAGYFYSCVAMCGIVGERLLKDWCRATPNVSSKRVEGSTARRAIRLLSELKVIRDSLRDDAMKLQTLRDEYTHARGANPQQDAAEAVKWLHSLIEGTVSVFKDFEASNFI
jgi:hypothetical protein